jgi:hypothetical protein
VALLKPQLNKLNIFFPQGQTNLPKRRKLVQWQSDSLPRSPLFDSTRRSGYTLNKQPKVGNKDLVIPPTAVTSTKIGSVPTFHFENTLILREFPWPPQLMYSSIFFHKSDITISHLKNPRTFIKFRTITMHQDNLGNFYLCSQLKDEGQTKFLSPITKRF